MKRFITSFVAMAAVMMASAMSYSQAREQAWFLTDKMAYELYLNVAQVDAVYEINLDYIMNVDVMGDLYGVYWERRTRELSYVLTNSQMHTFLASEHFYRPITWVSNSFHFTIYDRYPRARFYSSAPRGYTTYRGEYRHSSTSRFEGKFDDKKPNVTTSGRTLSNRTGVTTVTTNNGGFTNPGGTITNGRTRPSATTVTTTTRTGASGGQSGSNKVTTTTRTQPSVTSTGTMGSVRTGNATVTRTEATSKTSRTVSAATSSTVSGTKSGAVNNSARRH